MGNNYYFRISVRVWHPSIQPELITHALNLPPKRQWLVGSPRATPKGNLLEGIYAESYWCADISGEDPVNADETCLEDALVDGLSRLQAASAFLKSVREAKGRAEFLVGLYGRWNFGFEFSPDLLAKFSEIGLALSLDIYPNIESP
jgi:hypothetical protein